MAKVFEGIDDSLRRWIADQPMWFVATAPLSADGHVNVSPRGGDALTVLSTHEVAWVDFTGSGVETIAHLRENGRVCLMFASFTQRPRLVRLHGLGTVHEPGSPVFERVSASHPANPSTRAVISVDVTRVSDACGWGVPVMDLVTTDRGLIHQYADKKGPDGIAAYRREENTRSVDDLPGVSA